MEEVGAEGELLTAERQARFGQAPYSFLQNYHNNKDVADEGN